MSAIYQKLPRPSIYMKGSVNMSGIVRKLDYMRRIVLPREMCDLLYLKPGDLIELNLNNGKIEINFYSPDADVHNFVKNFIVSNFESKYHNIRVDEQVTINMTEKIKELIANTVLSKDN